MEEPGKRRYLRLYGTIVGGIVTAVLLLMVGSQVIGYDLYTGEELLSHRADRIRNAAHEARCRANPEQLDCPQTPDPTPKENSNNGSYEAPTSYADCINDVGVSDEECAKAFPDEAP